MTQSDARVTRSLSLQFRCKFTAISLQFQCNFTASSLQFHCKFTANSLQVHCKFTANSHHTKQNHKSRNRKNKLANSQKRGGWYRRCLAAGNLLLWGSKLHWGLDPKATWASSGAFHHSPLSTRGFLRADPGRNAECHLGTPPTHPRGRQRTRQRSSHPQPWRLKMDTYCIGWESGIVQQVSILSLQPPPDTIRRDSLRESRPRLP